MQDILSTSRRREPLRRASPSGRSPARHTGPAAPRKRASRLAAAVLTALGGCTAEESSAPSAQPAAIASQPAAIASQPPATGLESAVPAPSPAEPTPPRRAVPGTWPELHPGMPGLLSEAELAALRAARERALAEIADLPGFGFGEPASPERIAAWDIEIGPDGEGLPAGRGSVERGQTLYRLQCVQCHGAQGEGADYEALVGRVPGDAFPFSEDRRWLITVGSYWPYATTLFDYIRRAMPQAAPGTLPADDVYALTAYILQLNGLLEPGDSLDARTLPRIVMPARDRFVSDDRRGGPEVR